MKKSFRIFIALYCAFLNAACIHRTDIVEQMRTTRLAIEKQVEETRAAAIEGVNKFCQDVAAKGYDSDNIEDIQSTAATFSAYSHNSSAPIDSPDNKPLTITVETPGTLSQKLADYYKTEIIELTVIGNLNAADVSMLNNLPNLAILDMENVDLEVLPDNAFMWHKSLTSVKLPRTLTTIGDCAFQGCSSLTSITIPDSMAKIENCAFQGCSSLTNMTIPDSVTEIGRFVFAGCTNLTSVTIGNSVLSIDNGTFYMCSSLTSITIGNNVTSIRWEAFFSCTNLINIYCKAKTPPSVGTAAFHNVNAMLTLYVPTGSKAAYGCG